MVVTATAYAIGEVIRFNIRYAEPALASGSAGGLTIGLERFSDIALVLAYIISVSLYLRILSSFLLGALSADSQFNEQVITTVIISFIVILGVVKGLNSIEKLEFLSLAVTVIIISFIILDFAIYDIVVAIEGKLIWPAMPAGDPWDVARILAGTLIVVQGFETSRYLGNSFDSETRIKSSRLSQQISTVVYLLVVGLATPLMHFLKTPVNDNDLIVLAGQVIFFLPLMVIASAVLSQFSAAVADTIAGSGNMFEVSNKKIGDKPAYLFIGIAAIALTWSASTLGLVALASRAFAFYYLLQCLVALNFSKTGIQRIAILAIAAILAFVTVFAVPVG